MTLSVIILNYNVRYFLENCIRSVIRAIREIDAEIIVIDNDSKDDSCEMVARLFPEVRLIRNKENVGFAKANNQAVKEANGEYICVLNPDTVLPEDAFVKALYFAESKFDVGAIGVKLLDGTGNFLPESKRNVPTLAVAVKKLFNIYIGNTKDYYANHIEEDQTEKVKVLVGAFMLMRKVVYEEHNGFDEDYFMYGEDVDLCYRFIQSGYSNYYFPEVSMLHYKGESTVKDKVYVKNFFNAMQIFYHKHFNEWWFVKVVMNAFVFFMMLFVNTSKKRVRPEDPESVTLYSVYESLYTSMKKTLKVPVALREKLVFDSLPKGTQLVFDASSFSYSDIIKSMYKLRNKPCTFRIIPNRSDFMIGSDSSVDRGEVMPIVYIPETMG